jgi:hypothetical protein
MHAFERRRTMPFERFRFLNDDHVVDITAPYPHEPTEAQKHVRLTTARAQGAPLEYGFAYVGTIHKSKEGAAGVIRDGDGERPDARKVEVTFEHRGNEYARTFDAGAGWRWQFLTVEVYRQGSVTGGYRYFIRGFGVIHVEDDDTELKAHTYTPAAPDDELLPALPAVP